MPAGERRTKDQEMSQRLKREGVERWIGKCATCNGIIPNGLFEPSKNYAHIVSCPGGKKKGSGGHSAFQGHSGMKR